MIRNKSSVIGYSKWISKMKICDETSLQKSDVFEKVVIDTTILQKRIDTWILG